MSKQFHQKFLPSLNPKSWSGSTIWAVIFAITFGSFQLYCTAPYGVEVSPDSARHIAAARMLSEEGTLSLPVNTWFSESPTKPFSQWPPLYPLLLAFFAKVFSISPHQAARLLGFLSVIVCPFLVARLIPNRLCSFFVATVYLGSIVFFRWSSLAYTETLFAIFVLLLHVIINQPLIGSIKSGVAGITVGLATLTRYAGLSLFPLVLLSIILSYKRNKVAKKELLLNGFSFLFAFLLITLPWFLWLKHKNAHARSIAYYGFKNSFHLSEIWYSLTQWIVPSEYPILFNIFCILVLIFVFFRVAYKKPHPIMIHTACGVVSYLSFIIFARLFADPNIPFSLRIFAPANLLIAISLSVMVGSEVLKKHWSLILTFLLLLGAAPKFSSTYLKAKLGSPYVGPEWSSSELIKLIDELPGNAVIYSNAADALIFHQKKPIRWGVRTTQQSLYPLLKQKIESNSESVFVHFNNLAANRTSYIDPEDLLKSIRVKNFHVITFPDAKVVIVQN